MSKFIAKKLKARLVASLLKLSMLSFLLSSLVALLGARASDPSWFNYHTGVSTIANPLGQFGANLAATYFYLFGLVAYWGLLVLIYLLWLNLAPKVKLTDEWERILGFSGVGLSWLLIFKQGALGYWLYTKLNLIVDQLVIWVIGLTLFFTALTLILRFSVLVYLYQKLTAPTARRFYQKLLETGLKRGYQLLRVIINGVWVSMCKLYYALFGSANSTSPTGLDNSALEAVLFQAQYPDYQSGNSGALRQAQTGRDSVDLSYPNLGTLSLSKGDGVVRQAHHAYSPSNTQQNLESTNLDNSASCQSNQNPEQLQRAYKLPDLTIFSAMRTAYVQDEQVTKFLQRQAKVLTEKLKCFGIFGQIVAVEYGPVVSLFEFKPHIDSKVSKIIALEHDLALALETTSLRIIAPVPGKSVVGFEVANRERRAVLFGELITNPDFVPTKYALPLILGQDTIGKPVTIDLVKMPHLLIAGSTGAGKSVALNTMLTSLLCCCPPQNLKLILVDPKRLEFAGYEDIPHLLFPIAAEPRTVINILKWVVQEMEQRYLLMSEVGVKNITEYHAYSAEQQLAHLPYLVVVIDELADLMMTAGKEVEHCIIRIAQKARAAGIHLIVATQRPSVDVITGLIKINFPSRISFRVASKVDSRTVLDCMGAEKLLGRGDMLFLDSQTIGLRRVHGAYVSNDEVKQIVQQILAEGRAQYLNLTQELKLTLSDEDSLGDAEVLLPEVLSFLRTTNEISISLLQRRFRIGYNRSARLIDLLEGQGYVLPADGSKMRRVNKAALV